METTPLEEGEEEDPELTKRRRSAKEEGEDDDAGQPWQLRRPQNWDEVLVVEEKVREMAMAAVKRKKSLRKKETEMQTTEEEAEEETEAEAMESQRFKMGFCQAPSLSSLSLSLSRRIHMYILYFSSL